MQKNNINKKLTLSHLELLKERVLVFLEGVLEEIDRTITVVESIGSCEENKEGN